MKVKYSSNNSGGGWWLKDKDWLALEKAGWHVEWGGTYYCNSKYSFNEKPEGKPEPHANSDDCHGHRKYDSFKELGDERWLGSAAKGASKDFKTVQEAIKEFEKVTKQDVSDEGCNCCGAPHSFDWGKNYASGEDLLEYMYPDKPTTKTKRQLLEEQQ